MRVVCAMSGGVDSSVTAALLVEQGYEVIGMTMRLYNASGQPKGRGGTCCSPAEIDQAKQVCDQLGIPHYTVDESQLFQEKVIDDFAREYVAGRTPNPCVRCNEHIKFAPLWARAQALGGEFLATGHYARVENGELWRGVDASKDQSYFLFAMDRSLLSRVRFPLGSWRKEQVREKAQALNLSNWNTPDSQELCFVGGKEHGDVVEQYASKLGVAMEHLAPGDIVDEDGTILGQHQGIHRMTIGQRRGLRVAGSEARYVLRVLPETKQVVVGSEEQLLATKLEIIDVRRLAPLAEQQSVRALVQIRHRGTPAMATVEFEGNRGIATFDEPVRAVAPGQAAVLYAGDQVLGGGWIARASADSH